MTGGSTAAADAYRRLYRGPWRIDVTRRAGVPALVAIAALARAVSSALDAAGALRPASIGLILSDDDELARLNAEFMGAVGPTDVLSFPLLPPEAFPPHDGGAAVPHASRAPRPAFALPPGARIHLGDVVVSVARAIEQAQSGRGGHAGDVRWSPPEELLLLVTHGVLHVCGWDHADPVEEVAMRALERRLLGGA